MDYIHLLFTFLLTLVTALILLVSLGFWGGFAGCLIISLHNVWAGNIILRQGWRTTLNNFFLNFLVAFSIFLPLHLLIVWFKTGEFSPLSFLAAFFFAYGVIFFGLFGYRQKDVWESFYYRLRRKIGFRFKSREETSQILQNNLEKLCEIVSVNPELLPAYYRFSARLARKRNKDPRFVHKLEYTVSRLISVMLSDNEIGQAESLFWHYARKINPYTGVCGYKTNLIANALALGIQSNDARIIGFVFDRMMGREFDVTSVENTSILFNLACYYAITGVTEKMQEAMRLALARGKSPEDFRREKDFSAYWQDREFIEILASA